MKRNLRRIYTLTTQPEGPTGREMEAIAQQIVETAQENAGRILHRLVSKHPEVLQTIQYVRRGNEFTIGIRPDRPAGPNNIAFYLAAKEAREHVWLRPAVEQVMLQHGAVHGFGGTIVTRGAGGRFVGVIR